MVVYSSYYNSPSQQAKILGKVVTAGGYKYYPDGVVIKDYSKPNQSYVPPRTPPVSTKTVNPPKNNSGGGTKSTVSNIPKKDIPNNTKQAVDSNLPPLQETTEQISVSGVKKGTTYDPISGVRTEYEINPTIIRGERYADSPGFYEPEKVIEQGGYTYKQYYGREGYQPAQEIKTKSFTPTSSITGRLASVARSARPDSFQSNLLNTLALYSSQYERYVGIGYGNARQRGVEASAQAYTIETFQPRIRENVGVINIVESLVVLKSLPNIARSGYRVIAGPKKLRSIEGVASEVLVGEKYGSARSFVYGTVEDRFFTNPFVAEVSDVQQYYRNIGKSISKGSFGELRIGKNVESFSIPTYDVGMAKNVKGIIKGQSLGSQGFRGPKIMGGISESEFLRIGNPSEAIIEGLSVKESNYFGVQRLRGYSGYEEAFPVYQRVFEVKNVESVQGFKRIVSKKSSKDLFQSLSESYEQAQKLVSSQEYLPRPISLSSVGESVKTKPVSKGVFGYSLTGNLPDTFVPASYRGVYDLLSVSTITGDRLNVFSSAGINNFLKPVNVNSVRSNFDNLIKSFSKKSVSSKILKRESVSPFEALKNNISVEELSLQRARLGEKTSSKSRARNVSARSPIPRIIFRPYKPIPLTLPSLKPKNSARVLKNSFSNLFKRRFDYRPSATAIVFNIRGKSKKKKGFTGLELRPIL